MTYHLELYLEDLYFSQRQEKPPINPKKWQEYLEKWLNSLDLKLDAQKSYEMTLRLTDDEDIQNFNYQFRNKNQPTDVLSFAALETDFPELELDSVILGDVIISVETASRQAQQLGHPLQLELLWLASHGLLHLLGWDHPDEHSLQEMISLQTSLLASIGYHYQYT